MEQDETLAPPSPRGLTLSVCVSTNHGQVHVLDQLLDRLAAEPGAEDLEVCISDSATSDGTREVIERHRPTFGERLHYVRNYRSVGLGENIFRAVEMASGDYCWLLSADDAPAAGAVERVRSLLAQHRGTSGLTVGPLRVRQGDLNTPAGIIGPEAVPAARATVRHTALREVAETGGYLALVISCNVVRRDRWQAVVDAERKRALSFRSAAHVYVMGRMAAMHPDWVWCPELLVLSRQSGRLVVESQEFGDDGGQTVRQLLEDLHRTWATLYGPRSYLYRALMHKALCQLWSPETIISCRLPQAPGLYTGLAQFASVRHFWWSRRFWKTSFPAMVVPVGLLRVGCGPRREGASRLLEFADQRRSEIRGKLPATMVAGYSARVRVRVKNRSSQPLSSAEPFPVMVASRWRREGDDLQLQLSHAVRLWPPLRPGASRIVELVLQPPMDAGEHELNISLVQRFGCWFDVDSAEHALRSTVTVTPPPGLQTEMLHTAAERRSRIHGELPRTVSSARTAPLSVRVENLGSTALSSAEPYPVMLAARWRREGDEESSQFDGGTRLWPALAPGRSRTIEMVLGTPAEPGTYELNVSLVQRLGCWFDVDGPGHALTGEVSVALHADGHRGEVAPDVEPNIGGPEARPPDLLERAVEEELPGVDEMVAELGDAPELWRAGRFWEALNERVSRLDGPEFFTFKRTENALYFTFVVLSPLHENFRAALRGWLRRPRPSTLLARPDPAAVDVRWFQSYAAGGSVPGPLRRWTYALHVAMIWDLARERLGPELDSLQEPRLGDPLSIKHRGLRISHDLANSALELSTIAEGMPHERLASAHVIELGGGYGRVAWAMLSLHRGVRYVVVDIPPSLAVAQRYLTETLPDRSVFRFRRFEDPDEVIDEIVNAEMVFLTPNQLAMLPPLGVDLWVNISSLHEMRREQIAAHLEQAGRHVAGWAYTKQWIVSLNMADEVVLEQDDYPYPTHWQRLIERRHPAQPGYFEALFSTTSVAQQSAVARSAPRGQAASDLVIAGSASTPQA